LQQHRYRLAERARQLRDISPSTASEAIRHE
jgi:hypothetical protein